MMSKAGTAADIFIVRIMLLACGSALLSSRSASAQEILQIIPVEEYREAEFSPDLDGDGHWDLILSNETYSVSMLSQVGRVWVLSGATGEPVYEIVGTVEEERLGAEIELLDDLDGDGIVEIIALGDAKLVVWSGKSGSEIFQQAIGGESLARLGDATGDSLEDFVVGRPFFLSEGEARLYEGGTFATAYTIPGPPSWSLFGLETLGLGDVDGDGVPDFAVGAPGLLEAKFDCSPGHVGVFSGAGGAMIYSLQGEWPKSMFGSSLAAPGDFTGDGVGDLVVGSPSSGGFLCPGHQPDQRIYFFDGPTGGLVEAIDPPEGLGTKFGSSLGAAGDIDGNGWPDVLTVSRSPVRILVFDGGTRELIYSIPNPFPEFSNYGFPLFGVGDLDGDDFPEFLSGRTTGAPGQSHIDVWSTAPLGVSVFGEFCPNSTGEPPRIGATGSARLGSSWKVNLSRVEPGLPALLAVGFSSTSWAGTPLPLALDGVGMPGCELLVAPSALLSAVTTPVGPGKGAASVPLEIPENGSILGASLFLQWAVLHPPGSSSLGAATRGLEATVLSAEGGFPPTIGSITPSTIEALVPGTEQTVSITGTEFTPSTELFVDGLPVTGNPPPFTVVSSTEITLDMPQVGDLGPVEIQVSNGHGTATAAIEVVPPELPKLQAGSGDEPVLAFPADGLEVLASSLPGDLFLLYWSPSPLSSVVPGVLELEIGNGFTSLFPFAELEIDPVQAWTKLDVGLAGIPLFSQIYLQGVALRASGVAFPLDASNSQHVLVLL